MIKTSLILTKIWDFFRWHPMTQEEINKERFNNNVWASLLALVFILFFLFIDQIPVNYVLSIYSVFTEMWFKLSIATGSVLFFIMALQYKNFSYILIISIFSFGHFLFVNVYNDRSSLSSKVEVKKEKIKYYSAHWNIG